MTMKVQLRKRDVARHLRRASTDVESMLWACLRGRQISGLKFPRQHPVGGFVVDFFCTSGSLAVELDGEHNAAADLDRSALLQRRGVAVIRFMNELVRSDIEHVLSEIDATC